MQVWEKRRRIKWRSKAARKSEMRGEQSKIKIKDTRVRKGPVEKRKR